MVCADTRILRANQIAVFSHVMRDVKYMALLIKLSICTVLAIYTTSTKIYWEYYNVQEIASLLSCTIEFMELHYIALGNQCNVEGLIVKLTLCRLNQK